MSYNENIDFQTNALRSFIKGSVDGVPTDNEEPLDFSLSDLPLGEYPEDVSYAIPYDKERSTTDKVLDTVQDFGVATLGGMAQIVPTAMQVGAFVPRQVNSIVGKTADALGLDSLELATKKFEDKTASLIDDTYSGIRQGVEELTSDYGRYAKQKGFQWSDPLSDESLYSITMGVGDFIGSMASMPGFGAGAKVGKTVAGKVGEYALKGSEKVVPELTQATAKGLNKIVNYTHKVANKLATRYPVNKVTNAMGKMLSKQNIGSHMLYWAGISANELQNEAYNAFDRIPKEHKMYSPKFKHILELVQNQKPELTPDQQYEYANSLARAEFGKDATYSTIGALSMIVDTFGDTFVSGVGKLGKNALTDILQKTLGEGVAEGGSTYLKGKSINSALDDWGIYYKDESASTDEIINSAVMGMVIGGGISSASNIGKAGIDYAQNRDAKKTVDDTVNNTDVEQTTNTNEDLTQPQEQEQPQEQTADKQQDVLTDVEVGTGDNNAVNEKSEQIQSTDDNTTPQYSLLEDEKDFLTNAKEIIGVDLGKSNNLVDTIKDIDKWVDRQQALIENDALRESELSAYNEIIKLRQKLENRRVNELNKATTSDEQDNVQSTVQDNTQANVQENVQTDIQDNTQTDVQDTVQNDVQTDEQNKQAENVVEEFSNVEELLAPNVETNATPTNVKQDTSAQGTVVPDVANVQDVDNNSAQNSFDAKAKQSEIQSELDKLNSIKKEDLKPSEISALENEKKRLQGLKEKTNQVEINNNKIARAKAENNQDEVVLLEKANAKLGSKINSSKPEPVIANIKDKQETTDKVSSDTAQELTQSPQPKEESRKEVKNTRDEREKIKQQAATLASQKGNYKEEDYNNRMAELQDLYTKKLLEEYVDDVDVSNEEIYNKKLNNYKKTHKKIKEFHDKVMRENNEKKKASSTIEFNSSEKLIDALKAKRKEYLDSQKSKTETDNSSTEPTTEKQTVSQANEVKEETKQPTVKETKVEDVKTEENKPKETKNEETKSKETTEQKKEEPIKEESSKVKEDTQATKKPLEQSPEVKEKTKSKILEKGLTAETVKNKKGNQAKVQSIENAVANTIVETTENIDSLQNELQQVTDETTRQELNEELIVEQNVLAKAKEIQESEIVAKRSTEPTFTDKNTTYINEEVASVNGISTEYINQVNSTPVAYVSSNGKSTNARVPVTLEEPTKKALKEVSKYAKEQGFKDLRSFVIDRTGITNPDALNDIQVDSVAMAIRNLENGHGLLVGDQTGLGKGRQAAAMISYLIKSKKIPVFVTENNSLYDDILRDLNDIGVEVNPYVTNDTRTRDFFTRESSKKYYDQNRIWQQDKIKNMPKEQEGQNVIFTTYSQMQGTKFFKDTDTLLALSDDKYVFVFDESHKFATDSKGNALDDVINSVTKNRTKPSIYFSATSSKRISMLQQYLLSIGKSKDDIKRLVNTLKNGSDDVKNLISSSLVRELISEGKMIVRENDNSNVINKSADVKLSKSQIEIFDTAVDSIRQSHTNFENLSEIFKSKKKENQSEDNDNLASISKETLYDIVALNTKINYVVKQVSEDIKQGFAPVITFHNTFNSVTNLVEQNDNLSFSDLLANYILSELNLSTEVLNKEDKRPAKEILIDNLKSSANKSLLKVLKGELDDKINISPIDKIRQDLSSKGITVGEISGRKRIVEKDNNTYKLVDKKENRTDVADKFNSGELDVVMFNSSGATGISLHANSIFKNQKQRKQYFIQHMPDINATVQAEGRTNRTGQTSAPVIEHVYNDLATDKREKIIHNNRVNKLNNATRATSKMDIDENFYNYIGARACLRTLLYLDNKNVIDLYLYINEENPISEDISSYSDIQYYLGSEDKNNAKAEKIVKKILDAIKLAPSKEQETFLNELREFYDIEAKRERDNGVFIPNEVASLNAEPIRQYRISKDDVSTKLTVAKIKQDYLNILSDKFSTEKLRVASGKAVDVFGAIKDKLVNEWGKKYELAIVDIGSEYKFARCINEANRHYVLMDITYDNKSLVSGELDHTKLETIDKGSLKFLYATDEGDLGKGFKAFDISKIYSFAYSVYDKRATAYESDKKINENSLETALNNLARHRENLKNGRESLIVTGDAVTLANFHKNGDLIRFTSKDGNVETGIVLHQSVSAEKRIKEVFGNKEPYVVESTDENIKFKRTHTKNGDLSNDSHIVINDFNYDKPPLKHIKEKEIQQFFDNYKKDKPLLENVSLVVLNDDNAVSEYLSDIDYKGNKDANVVGMFNAERNEIVLNASRIENTQKAKEVIFHEVVGHYGFNKILTEKERQEYNKLMDELVKENDLEMLQELYGNDKELLHEELFANYVEKKISSPIWSKIKAFIGKILSRLGIHILEKDAVMNDMFNTIVKGFANPRVNGDLHNSIARQVNFKLDLRDNVKQKLPSFGSTDSKVAKQNLLDWVVDEGTVGELLADKKASKESREFFKKQVGLRDTYAMVNSKEKDKLEEFIAKQKELLNNDENAEVQLGEFANLMTLNSFKIEDLENNIEFKDLEIVQRVNDNAIKKLISKEQMSTELKKLAIEYDKAKDKYKKLSANQIKVYKNIRQYHVDEFIKLKDLMLEVAERVGYGKDQLNKIQEIIDEETNVGDYFPLIRKGDFKVAYTIIDNGLEYLVDERFLTRMDADKHIDELKEKIKKGEVKLANKSLPIIENVTKTSDSDIDTKIDNENLLLILKELKVPDDNKDFVEKEEMISDLNQILYNLISERNPLKSMRQRRNIRGANNYILRNTAERGIANANFYAQSLVEDRFIKSFNDFSTLISMNRMIDNERETMTRALKNYIKNDYDLTKISEDDKHQILRLTSNSNFGRTYLRNFTLENIDTLNWTTEQINKAEYLLNTMKKRHELDKVAFANSFISVAMGLSFVGEIGLQVGTVFVNTFQIATHTFPRLYADSDFITANKVLLKGLKETGLGKQKFSPKNFFKNLLDNKALVSLSRRLKEVNKASPESLSTDEKQLVRIFDKLERLGILTNGDQYFDLLQRNDGEGERRLGLFFDRLIKKYTGINLGLETVFKNSKFWGRIKSVMGSLYLTSEVAIKECVTVASFYNYKKSNPNATDKELFDYIQKTIHDTQFEYRTNRSGRLFRPGGSPGDVHLLLSQYKKYPIGFALNQYMDARTLIESDDPKERKKKLKEIIAKNIILTSLGGVGATGVVGGLFNGFLWLLGAMLGDDEDDKLTAYDGSYKVLRNNLGEHYADWARYGLISTATGIDLSGKMANSWTVWGNYDWVRNSKEVGKEAGRQILPAIWNPIEKTINTATSDKGWIERIGKDFPVKFGRNLTNLFMDLSNHNYEKAMNSVLGTTHVKEKKEIEKKNRSRKGTKKIFEKKNKLY